MEIYIEKQKKRMLIVILLSLFLFISFFISYTKYQAENLAIGFYSTTTPILIGERTTFQVLVYDHYVPIKRAKVTVRFTDEYELMEPMREKLSYVENGLYETDVQFFQWGNWNVDVEVKVGNQVHQKNFTIFVDK